MEPNWTQLRIELRPEARPSSPWLQALYDLWLTKGNGRIPRRGDIDPMLECDPRLLPQLFLLDVLRDPLDFRYRVIGTAIVAVEGRDNTGRRLGECGFGRYETMLRTVYEKVVAERAPLGVTGTMLWRGTDPLEVEAVHLPLTTQGRSVDMILGAALFARIRNGTLVQWADR